MNKAFTRIKTERTEHKIFRWLESRVRLLVQQLESYGLHVKARQEHDGTVKVLVAATSSAPTGELYSIGWGGNGLIGYTFEGAVRIN